MKQRLRWKIGIAVLILIAWRGRLIVAGEIHPTSENLVENPSFETADPSGRSPAGWHAMSTRNEIAPIFELDSSVTRSGKYSARLSAQGIPGTFGFWKTTAQGIQGGSVPSTAKAKDALTLSNSEYLGNIAYSVRCFFRTQGIDQLSKSVWIRLRWRDSAGEELLTEYLSSWSREGGWTKAEQVFTAPLFAKSLDLELALLWTSSGTIWWDDVSVDKTEVPRSRHLKLATVSFEPPSPSTPERNRKFFVEKVSAAARAGADFVCLGEGITMISTGKGFVEVAEPASGPTSQILGRVAKQYRVYVVAGIYEREGPLVYNTALLIGREGEVVGKYRKTHLPETEVTGGLTPGATYPVFKTDFGVVGIQTCYDNFFPEVARSLVLHGAEIIFLPIWGDLRGQGYEWDIIARARAIDNAVFLVASIYSNKRSLIIDPNGRILADTAGQSGLVMADVDLSARTFERWLSVPSYGEWKGLFRQERRSETYQTILEPLAR
jgi:predicted amidohydrolase